jgi:8-oxo-dGTP diphosphatase
VVWVNAPGFEKGPGVKAPSVLDAKPKIRPRVGVGVFVKKDGKILLQRRIGAHGAGSWSLPGGHLEYGESPEETAMREAREELNVDIKNPRVIGLTNDINAGEGKHYITIFVEAEYSCGDPKINEPDKTSDIMWCSIDSLPEPLFVPLKNFIENRRLL